MGTRADYYVGRGTEAEWLGSTAWDGFPDDLFDRNNMPQSEEDYRTHVARLLAEREDATLPEQGWPWPWDDSRTTDYAYAWDDGEAWASNFGYTWFKVAEGEPEDEQPDQAVFPDMTSIQNVTFGSRSGVMMIDQSGPIPAKDIDTQEATQTMSESNVGGSPNDWSDAQEALTIIRAVVDEQAEDDGLWFMASTASEAYLQQELRRLHSVIEMSMTDNAAWNNLP